MKIIVDEMPTQPRNCSFSNWYTYVCTCRLSSGETYICNDTSECPYLKAVEEKE